MSSARSAITRLGLARSFQIGASRSVESTRGPAIRCFSDDKRSGAQRRGMRGFDHSGGREDAVEEKKKLEQQKPEDEIGSARTNLEKERLLDEKLKLEQQKPENEKGSGGKKHEESKP